LHLRISPHRLTPQTFEVWLDPSVPASLLSLGQVLRIEADTPGTQPPCYAEIAGLENDAETPYGPDASRLASLNILSGTPSLAAESICILSDAELLEALQHVSGKTDSPLCWTTGAPASGSVTLLQAPSTLHVETTLQHLLQATSPHQKTVIIDPVGSLLHATPNIVHCTLGQDVKFSLQRFGLNRFLSLVSQDLPEGLREEALRLLARQAPATPDFIPFKHFLRPERYMDLAAKTPLLHQLFNLYQAGLFADTPQEAFSPKHLLTASVSRLDISNLPSAWRLELMDALWQEVFALAPTQTTFVLVEPYAWMEDVATFCQQARLCGLPLVLAVTSESPELFAITPDNTLTVQENGHATLRGKATLGFPYRFETEPHPSEEKPQDAATSSSHQAYPGFALPVEESEINAAEPYAAFDDFASFTFEPAEPTTPKGPLPQDETYTPPSNELAYQEGLETLNQEDPASWITDSPLSPTSPPQPTEPHLLEESYLGEGYLIDIPDEEFVISPGSPSFQASPSTATEEPPTEAFPAETPFYEETASPEPLAEEAFTPPAFPPPEPEAETWADDDFSFEMSDQVDTAWTEIIPQHEPQQVDWDTPPPPETAEEEASHPSSPQTWEDTSDDEPEQQETLPVYRIHDAEQQQIALEAGYQEGEQIRHEKYGVGVINKVIPMEGSVVLNVTFESVGKRLLDPALSHLEKV